MIYFTSDMHLFHKKILEYEPNRLSWCTNVEDMSEILINDILSLNADDTLYILGDFLFDKFNRAEYICERLYERKCQMVLVLGNHDTELFKYQHVLDMFAIVDNYIEIFYNKIRFCMSHYPFAEWHNRDKKNEKSVMLHGHLHSKPCSFRHPRLINVGVDSKQYKGRMISIDDLIKLIEIREQQFKDGYNDELLKIVDYRVDQSLERNCD